MTKVKLKDATKELLKGAEDMLGSVSTMRKSADDLAQAARKLENQFLREEEQRRAEEKQAEQQRLLSQHAKAYTMPDMDEAEEAPKVETKAEVKPVAPKEEARPAPAEEKKPAPAKQAEAPAAPQPAAQPTAQPTPAVAQ